jgi:Flp pilus assembly pilin Flp
MAKSRMGMLLKNNKGQGMTEYIIIVVLVVVAGLVVWKAFGDKIVGLVKDSTTQIEQNVKPVPK